LETVPSVKGKPANVVFCPSPRDKAWLKLFEKHRWKDKITADFGFEAFTTPPIAAFPSCDAKFTTSAMAKELKSWALFGPPLGRTWEATDDERAKYSDIRPLVGNDWALLHCKAPPEVKDAAKAVDLDAGSAPASDPAADELSQAAKLPPAWPGTLLPEGAADVWLAAAFAEYEKIVAVENSLKEKAKDGKLTEADREKLSLALFGARSRWKTAVARLGKDVKLSQTRRDLTR